MAAAFRNDSAKLETQASSLDVKDATPGNQTGLTARFSDACFRTLRSPGVFFRQRLWTETTVAAAAPLQGSTS